MSLSAVLLLAAATTSGQAETLSHGPRVAQARVVATILPAVAVRQASGPEPVRDDAPHHQLSRRGNTILVEFQ